jgi:hypothetical protein
MKDVEVANVIEAAIESVAATAAADGIAITAKLDPIRQTVRGDPARIEQILWESAFERVGVHAGRRECAGGDPCSGDFVAPNCMRQDNPYRNVEAV